METQMKRPAVIWLSLVYIAVLVLYNLQLLYFKWDAFVQSGYSSTTFLVLNLVFCVLMIFTFVAIRDQSIWGQRLGILCFAMNGVFAISSAVVLFNWPDGISRNGLLSGRLLVVGRILISFFLTFAIGASKSANEYFSVGSESTAIDLPPPPTFDA